MTKFILQNFTLVTQSAAPPYKFLIQQLGQTFLLYVSRTFLIITQSGIRNKTENKFPLPLLSHL